MRNKPLANKILRHANERYAALSCYALSPSAKGVVMSKKTLVGGFGDDWSALLALLVALGVLPKSSRTAIGAAGTAMLVYWILKRLGWL